MAARKSITVGPELHQRQPFIERAAAVALDVDEDALEAEAAEARVKLGGPFEQTRNFGRDDLDPGGIAVVPHAELTEAVPSHDLLRLLDLPQPLRGDGEAVREAAGQAGRRGLLPGREPQPPRELANLGLRQPRLEERRSDTDSLAACMPGR